MLLWQISFVCQGYRCCGKHKDYCGKYKGCCRKYKDCCHQCKYCCHKYRYYSGKYKKCCGKYKYCCGKCSWLGGERCSRLSQSTRPQLGLIAPSPPSPVLLPTPNHHSLDPYPTPTHLVHSYHAYQYHPDSLMPWFQPPLHPLPPPSASTNLSGDTKATANRVYRVRNCCCPHSWVPTVPCPNALLAANVSWPAA